MTTHPTSESRVALALAGAARTPAPAGITYATPEALSFFARDAEFPQALAAAVRDLRLDFAFVPAAYPDADEAAAAVIEAGAAVAWAVEGPLGITLAERGWTASIALAATDPAALADDLEVRTLAASEEVDRGLAAGATVLVIADDLASSEGPLVPPDFAFDEVFPRMARLVEVALDEDVPAVLHTDGDARAFLHAAHAAGFAGIHAGGGLRWEAFARLHAAARADGLAVVGGLPTLELADGEAAAVRVGTLARYVEEYTRE
ncbi:MAG: hypothetical protein FDZ70_07370, partial [Actinobacteria bacterium]